MHGGRGSSGLCTGDRSPGSARFAARCSSAIARASASRSLRATHAREQRGAPFDGADEDAPHAEEPRGDRALHRLRRARVDEPRRDRARREAVLHQRDEARVEHRGLRGRWHRARHEEERHLGERHLADQLAAEALAADDHVVAANGSRGSSSFRVSSVLLFGDAGASRARGAGPCRRRCAGIRSSAMKWISFGCL